MKRYLFLFLIVTIYGCREQANRPARTSTRTGVASYSNPLLTSGADPYAIYHDGVYYYTQSMYDHLSIWKTKDITDLRHARSKTVWIPDDLTNSRDLWAPELHYLDGKWYLYYAAAGIRAGSHQLYVLENSHPDPTEGRFIYKGQLRTSADQSWAVDASVFTHRDSLYLVWFGIPEQPIPYIFNCIYIARLENPWTLATRPVMIGIPDQRWERHDPEAAFSMGSPQPLKSPDGNLIHLVYSAGGNRPPYSALGLMTAQSGSNLLDPASWKKSPQPVFCQNDTLGVSAPEHCSFIKSPDGTEDYIFYHARYRLEPAANDLRTPRLQKFSWDKKGFPVFGQPIPCHVKQPKPSGTAI